MKSNVLKYSVLLFLLLIMVGGYYYLNLSTRHKAIVKTKIQHGLGLVDNSWEVKRFTGITEFISPTLVVDDIYKSMEGPKVMRGFQLDPSKSDLVFINSFKTEALSTNEVDRMSNDYICHSNVDYYDGEHFGRWGLQERIGEQYPRLTSMSHGIENYKLPDGFGFPVFTDENLFLSTQILNHNIRREQFSVKHKLSLGYQPANSQLRPLSSKTVFIMLPFDKDNPFIGPTDQNPNSCLPVETKNHTYMDETGQALSGHWVIFPGRAEYRSEITSQLAIKDSLKLHYAAIHVHPFAESISLRDKTANKEIFTSEVVNHSGKIGLKKVADFSSAEGVSLYASNKYELVLKVNNTTSVNQDMMGSMFLFFYDEEMDQKIKTYLSTR